jgi:hypothetical protein
VCRITLSASHPLADVALSCNSKAPGSPGTFDPRRNPDQIVSFVSDTVVSGGKRIPHEFQITNLNSSDGDTPSNKSKGGEL